VNVHGQLRKGVPAACVLGGRNSLHEIPELKYLQQQREAGRGALSGFMWLSGGGLFTETFGLIKHVEFLDQLSDY
jgi:hypothetical protein